jgi:hypothetical protein
VERNSFTSRGVVGKGGKHRGRRFWKQAAEPHPGSPNTQTFQFGVVAMFVHRVSHLASSNRGRAIRFGRRCNRPPERQLLTEIVDSCQLTKSLDRFYWICAYEHVGGFVARAGRQLPTPSCGLRLSVIGGLSSSDLGRGYAQ